MRAVAVAGHRTLLEFPQSSGGPCFEALQAFAVVNAATIAERPCSGIVTGVFSHEHVLGQPEQRSRELLSRPVAGDVAMAIGRASVSSSRPSMRSDPRALSTYRRRRSVSASRPGLCEFPLSLF